MSAAILDFYYFEEFWGIFTLEIQQIRAQYIELPLETLYAINLHNLPPAF